MPEWNADLYMKFGSERTQPSIDLVSRLSKLNPKNILDVGCGPGNSSEVLKSVFPDANVLGIDNSDEMIRKAKKIYSNIDFMLHDASKGFDGLNKNYDIVYSNACIQWIPDHRNLIKNMMDLLKENGVLAVQIPYNYDEPIYKIIMDVTNSEKWRDILGNVRLRFSLEISDYYDLLAEVSTDFDMWQTVYFHKMDSHEAILEWYKGTGLRPYLEKLDSGQKQEFEAEILSRIREEYPVQKNGDVIFKFPRLFFTAVK